MKTSTETLRAYLSTSQTEELTGIKMVTLELWRRKGTGPAFIKAGRRVLYARADIDQWLAANRCGGAQ